jgi:molecular chaperone Hsp33
MTEWPPARVTRALTSDRQIRLAALDASSLWDGARRGHPHLDAAACACLMELLSATVLLNSRALFLERLQLFIKGSGRARTVVSDCWPDGTIRGFLDLSGRADGPWIEAPGSLRAMRSSASGRPLIGTLALADGPLQAQVEAYLLQSEKTQASLTLWCDPSTGLAGGLLVEPLPECPPSRLRRLVQAIECLEVLQDHERVPAFLVDWVNGGEGSEILGNVDLVYRCRCTRTNLLGTLLGFPESRRRDLFDSNSKGNIRCDYCGTTYLLDRREILPEEEAS